MNWEFYLIIGALVMYFVFSKVYEVFTNESDITTKQFPCKKCRLLNPDRAKEKCDPLCQQQNGIYTGKYKSVNITDGLCECSGSFPVEKTLVSPTRQLDANDKKNLSKSFKAFTKTRR
jgi:hypothetical protein